MPTPTGNFVFQVDLGDPRAGAGLRRDDHPASGGAPARSATRSSSRSRAQQQQEALSAFSNDFRDYWTNLTQCASDYVIQGCDNFDGGGPTCDPDKLAASQPGQTSQGCPAPVFATCQEGTPAQGGQAGQLQCTGSGPGGPPSTVGSFKPFVPVDAWSTAGAASARRGNNRARPPVSIPRAHRGLVRIATPLYLEALRSPR